MGSLRARLLASVLVLSAVGLLLLGAVTYFEQRSFQLKRIDQQARSAPPAVAAALSNRGFGPALGDPDDDHRGGPPGGGPDVRLQLGTYGERRDAAGRTIGAPVVFGYGQNVTADPELPAKITIGRPFTVEGENGDPNDYRVFAERDRRGSGIIVAAVPLREVDQTLRRLLAVEALVIAGVLLLLGFAAWAVVRVGLCRPTAWATRPARSPAATCRTASSRPTRARRSAGSGSRSTRCSTASRARSPRASRARTACASSSPTPPTSCAHRSRRSAATPSCSAWAQRASRPMSRRRCAGSRTRRRAWACSSRTS